LIRLISTILLIVSPPLLFGGWNGKDYYNDLHILDLEIMAWKRANPSGPAPSPRQGHASILIGNNLIVHGGYK
jgi:host cell factor